MNARSRNSLSKRQRSLLEQTRDSIRDTPRSYSQLTMGTGTLSCSTPACVAGHMVASEPELRTKLRAALREQHLLEPDCDDEEYRARWNERRSADDYRYNTGTVIEDIAREGLGTPTHPALFDTEWPRAWLKQLDIRREGIEETRAHGETFVPTAGDAVRILDGILNGHIHSSLATGYSPDTADEYAATHA